VIPTYNERENIEQLLAELASIAPLLNRPYEVVLVDDRSPDGTAELASQLGRAKGVDVRVLTRNGPRSMGGAIARGLAVCRRDLVCVMDADLSHPPGLLPSLIESLDGADGAVASRYVPGAIIEGWPASRHLISFVATLIARLGLRARCRDPLSGFFLFRRAFLESLRIQGDGNKPLLEVLVQARPVVNELPYVFRNRKNGESKLNARSIVEFVALVLRLRSISRRDAPTRPRPSGLWEPHPPQP
jgi:dolichol-phosphate mannosyltransferase